jgi:hypothetical protein
MVAEEPTFHQTFTVSEAELVMFTMAPEARVRVYFDWKIHAALGSFCPSKVRVPVNA